MDDYKIKIGKRIETALAVSRKKQKDLAEYLGILPNTVSYFCKGTRTPNTEQIIKIAQFLDVSADYLLGLSEAMTINEDIQTVCKVTGLSEIAIRNLCAAQYENDSIHEVLSYLFEELISVFEGEEEGYQLKGTIYDLMVYFTIPRNENNTFFDITFNGDFGVTGTKFTTNKGTLWQSLFTACRIESSDIIDKLLFDKLCDSLKKSKTDFDLKKESEKNG